MEYERYAIMPQSDHPSLRRIPRGFRLVKARVGRKWVSIQGAGFSARLPIAVWREHVPHVRVYPSTSMATALLELREGGK